MIHTQGFQYIVGYIPLKGLFSGLLHSQRNQVKIITIVEILRTWLKEQGILVKYTDTFLDTHKAVEQYLFALVGTYTCQVAGQLLHGEVIGFLREIRHIVIE